MITIAGKDRNVFETIDIVKKILSDVGFVLEEKEMLNPVDGIWSVNLQDRHSQFYTNGKGAKKENAIASAYCEFLERLGSGFFFYDYALDGLYKENSWAYAPDEIIIFDKKNYKDEILSKKLWKFYDPDKELMFSDLIDSGRCNNDSIITLPFVNGYTNKEVLFPIELLKNIYASNGLSAGNSQNEAIVQGLSESIERGVKNYIISESISLPTITNTYLKENNFLSIKEEIESYGYKLLVKDASLGGRFPVICALLIDSTNGSVLSSFGAHPNPLIAIERTLTELLQGRRINSLNEFSTLTYNYDQVADDANLESHFVNSTGALHINIVKDCDDDMILWEFNGDRTSELNYLTDKLKKEGYDYFYRAYQIGEMWVVQAIIPQLSEIYPVEDLVVEHKNSVGIIRDILKSDSWNKKMVEDALNWFDESYIPGSSNILDYIGVSVSETDSLYDINSDEIELLLLISKKSIKKIHKILQHQVIYELINKQRVGFWLCLLGKLEGVKPETLKMLYTNDTFNYVELAIEGHIPRELYPPLKYDFSLIEQHKNYAEVYKKYVKLRS